MASKKDKRERKGKWQWADKIKLMQEFIKKEKSENPKSTGKNIK